MFLKLYYTFVFVQSWRCVWLCNPMKCNKPCFPVFHYLQEFAQTHVHWVSDAIQPSHPLLAPSPLAFNLPQHQGFFQRVSSSHQLAKVHLNSLLLHIKICFPGGSGSKESIWNVEDPIWSLELGRSPGERIGILLQYSCLENSMDRGAWQAAVHGVVKSWIWLRN